MLPLFIRCLLAASILAGPKAASRPADPPLPGDEPIHRLLADRALELDAAFEKELPTQQTWPGRRTAWRNQLLYMLGISPERERTPLHAEITGTLHREKFVVEKLSFQSSPHLYVTANLYLPANPPAASRLPAVLYLCGHGYSGPEGVKAGYQSNAIWFAKHGYVALVIDTLDRGEIRGTHRGLYSEGKHSWLSRGYSPAGAECWNAIRAIDYLASRPEVDPTRIAATGISGGGAYTIWVAAVDERAKVAVPVSGMADLQAYVGDRKINVHCDCMVFPNVFQWPWARIAALIAPRPMLFVNSDEDRFFPLDSTQRLAARLNLAYESAGAGHSFEALVSRGDHAYRRDILEKVYQFINEHLKGDSSLVTDSQEDLVIEKDGRSDYPIQPSDLRVFAIGKTPADEINTHIDEMFVPVARHELPLPGQFNSWKDELLGKLRETTFRTLPKTVLPARLLESDNSDQWLSSQVGSRFLVSRVGPTKSEARRVYLTVCMGDEKNSASDEELTALLPETDTPAQMYRCYPRGAGPLRWSTRSPPNEVERACALIGLTTDTLRIQDIAAAAEFLHKSHPNAELIAMGSGAAAVDAAYAALFAPAINSLILDRPGTSHLERGAPQFVGILRLCDMAEMFGLLAPKKLTFCNTAPTFLARVRAIYSSADSAMSIIPYGN